MYMSPSTVTNAFGVLHSTECFSALLISWIINAVFEQMSSASAGCIRSPAYSIKNSPLTKYRFVKTPCPVTKIKNHASACAKWQHKNAKCWWFSRLPEYMRKIPQIGWNNTIYNDKQNCQNYYQHISKLVARCRVTASATVLMGPIYHSTRNAHY